MKSFLTGGPAVKHGERLWEDVQIGFEHTVVDGVAFYPQDEDGQPVYVPRVRRFPARLTPGDHVRAAAQVRRYTADAGIDLTAVDGEQRIDAKEDVMVRLVSAVIGDTTLWDIYEDLTVTPEDFNALMEHLLDLWGWQTLMRDLFGEEADSFPFG